MRLSRREFLRSSSAAGALLLAPTITSRGHVLDLPLGRLQPGPGAERQSRLMPGTRLVHADLHNHTLMSDGAGDPAGAFASMRGHGLDVAALTDHSTVSKHLPQSLCQGSEDCQSLMGIDEASWARTAELADTADAPGTFTAIRGFEWSSPSLGHVNVWFSEDWTDPLHTGGAGTGEGAGQFAHDELEWQGNRPPPALTTAINDVTSRHGANVGMRLFYDWLAADPSRPALGGGSDGIAGFNHPGREVGRFGYFAFEPAVRDRFVSMEIFNRREDYLWRGTDADVESPLVQCLNAGWRVGLMGVTDEHGTDWGGPEGKGRAGLWVHELSRDGVREAMVARRFFATNVEGLRLAATARSGGTGRPVPMGQTLGHRDGPVTFRVDLDLGPDAVGQELSLQVLTAGTDLPEVAAIEPLPLTRDGAPFEVTVDLDVEDAPYVVLRVSDPSQPADGRAFGPLRTVGKGIAYASPFYLDPDAAPR